MSRYNRISNEILLELKHLAGYNYGSEEIDIDNDKDHMPFSITIKCAENIK